MEKGDVFTLAGTLQWSWRRRVLVWLGLREPPPLKLFRVTHITQGLTAHEETGEPEDPPAAQS